MPFTTSFLFFPVLIHKVFHSLTLTTHCSWWKMAKMPMDSWMSPAPKSPWVSTAHTALLWEPHCLGRAGWAGQRGRSGHQRRALSASSNLRAESLSLGELITGIYGVCSEFIVQNSVLSLLHRTLSTGHRREHPLPVTFAAGRASHCWSAGRHLQ